MSCLVLSQQVKKLCVHVLCRVVPTGKELCVHVMCGVVPTGKEAMCESHV